MSASIISRKSISEESKTEVEVLKRLNSFFKIIIKDVHNSICNIKGSRERLVSLTFDRKPELEVTSSLNKFILERTLDFLKDLKVSSWCLVIEEEKLANNDWLILKNLVNHKITRVLKSMPNQKISPEALSGKIIVYVISELRIQGTASEDLPMGSIQ